MSKKNRSFSFSTTPTIKMSRTKMPISYNRTMSASLGDLHCMYLEEVLPGDTFKVKSKIVSRLTSSFLKPAFANIFLDTYYFFVPARLVYDKWANIFGENTEGVWANSQNYETPRVSIKTGKSLVGTVYDDLELPIFETAPSGMILPNINVLWFRANALVYDQWFRDENFIQPMNISKGEVTPNEEINVLPWDVNNYTGKLPKVSKYHDYFTSVLPSPQKGESVVVGPGGFFPLVADTSNSYHYLGGPMRLSDGVSGPFNILDLKAIGSTYVPSMPMGTVYGVGEGDIETVPDPANTQYITHTNLGVNTGYEISVNDLRLAFQTQKMLEKDALYGTRYVEYLLGHFGVSSPDARLQRSEFLGGRRLNIGISQVAQTGASSSEGNLADLAGYSLSDGITGFSKGFTEHGFILGYCVYRQFHTYQQGLDRRFRRFTRLDYYDPVFANIGNQPVWQSQIYALTETDNVFGYQEAWADYRFHPNSVTGQMRSVAENSLDIWHLADEYTSAPVASKAFLEETPNYLDRAITVDSDVQDQFILDIWHDVEAVRVMPLRSVPGLIDHH